LLRMFPSTQTSPRPNGIISSNPSRATIMLAPPGAGSSPDSIGDRGQDEESEMSDGDTIDALLGDIGGFEVRLMVAKAKTIEIKPGSETARLLDEADRAPLVLVLGDRRYHLEHVTSDDEPYDPEEARRILADTAGAWADIDTEAMKKELRRARKEGSRSSDRPKPF
jgi:hypothetical protein